MVRVLTENFMDYGVHYYDFAGLSTDTKPKSGVATGSTFIEVNTGKSYLYDESGDGTWYQYPPESEG